jgi:cytochrome c553
MMKKSATVKMLLCSLFLVISGTVQAAGDAVAGKKKTTMCIGCHGIPGYRTAYPKVYNVPKIGGQHPDYLVKALKAYKTGARSHPSMKGIAATLSTQDMEDLAAYYAASGSK